MTIFDNARGRGSLRSICKAVKGRMERMVLHDCLIYPALNVTWLGPRLDLKS
jgi:hypothetical protein